MRYYAVFFINLDEALAGEPNGLQSVVPGRDDALAVRAAFRHPPSGHIPHLISETNLDGPDRVIWKGAFERAVTEGSTTAADIDLSQLGPQFRITIADDTDGDALYTGKREDAVQLRDWLNAYLDTFVEDDPEQTGEGETTAAAHYDSPEDDAVQPQPLEEREKGEC